MTNLPILLPILMNGCLRINRTTLKTGCFWCDSATSEVGLSNQEAGDGNLGFRPGLLYDHSNPL